MLLTVLKMSCFFIILFGSEFQNIVGNIFRETFGTLLNHHPEAEAAWAPLLPLSGPVQSSSRYSKRCNSPAVLDRGIRDFRERNRATAAETGWQFNGLKL